MFDDIAHILGEWPFDIKKVQARIISGPEGVPLIQMRVDLGVLQMERNGRPDGEEPSGYKSELHRYIHLLESFISTGKPAKDFRIKEGDHPKIDREILQFHHRRIALMKLSDYSRAARDAHHALRFIRFIARHADNAAYIAQHMSSLPYLIVEYIRARALGAIRSQKPKLAVKHIEDGITMINHHVKSSSQELNASSKREINRLRHWSKELCIKHHITPPLENMLSSAVEREDYEEAARLRDEIAKGL